MFLQSAHWRHSVKDLLEALGAHPTESEKVETIESIRQAMLEVVKQADAGKTLAPKVRLTCRIGSCRDVQALWYLRSEIMQLLSASKGEREARVQLDAISVLFKGLLPSSLNPRQAFVQDGSGSIPRRS